MLAVAVEALHQGFLYAVLGVVIFTTISATTLKVAVFTSMPETMAVEALCDVSMNRFVSFPRNDDVEHRSNCLQLR